MRRQASSTRAAPYRADDAAAQVLRLLETWWAHEWQNTSHGALGHWFSSTAAWGATLPRADIAIAMAEHLKLYRGNRDVIVVDPMLARVHPTLAREVARSKIAAVVFDRLLESEVFASELRPVFSWMQIRSGLPTVDWAAVPLDTRQMRGWIWLQQLGLGEHTDDRFIADERIATFVAAVDKEHVGVRLTPEELDRRLALQRQRGAMAEEMIIAVEKERLRIAGVPGLADEVVRVSLEDVAAGYDVRSFDTDGAPRFIEVKSSAGPRDLFFLSENEAQAARDHGMRYWLAWVGWSIRLPDGPCDIAYFRDLGSLLKRPPRAWRCEPEGWVVRRVSDDSSFSSR